MREVARSARENIPLGIMMADLDWFKLVNDTYGHMAGDAVLREVAGRIATAIRPYDAAGRYGGEEFLLVIPGCDEVVSLQTAERLREAISQTPIRVGDVMLPVTMSFGVTVLPRGVAAEPDMLLRVADSALYRAKQLGRNRCVRLPFAETALMRPSA